MQPNTQQFVNQFAKPEPWVKLTSVFLLVASLYLAAKLVWLWVDAFSVDYRIPESQVTPSSSPSRSSEVSVDAVVSKHLFGDVDARPQEVVEERPVEAAETRLPLKLRGIYASEDDQRANAIIEVGGGQQEVYFIGDKIEGGSGATLHQVFATKVILNRNGQLESLTLEQEESVISMQPDSAPKSLQGPKDEARSSAEVVDNPRIKRELGELKQKLQSDPGSLQDMLRWEPVMENGMLQGVRISPGKARRLFYELKLRRNDIVTNINGTPLSDPSQLLTLQQELSSASEISLSVLRNGQPQDITIKLNDAK